MSTGMLADDTASHSMVLKPLSSDVRTRKNRPGSGSYLPVPGEKPAHHRRSSSDGGLKTVQFDMTKVEHIPTTAVSRDLTVAETVPSEMSEPAQPICEPLPSEPADAPVAVPPAEVPASAPAASASLPESIAAASELLHAPAPQQEAAREGEAWRVDATEGEEREGEGEQNTHLQALAASNSSAVLCSEPSNGSALAIIRHAEQEEERRTSDETAPVDQSPCNQSIPSSPVDPDATWSAPSAGASAVVIGQLHASSSSSELGGKRRNFKLNNPPSVTVTSDSTDRYSAPPTPYPQPVDSCSTIPEPGSFTDGALAMDSHLATDAVEGNDLLTSSTPPGLPRSESTATMVQNASNDYIDAGGSLLDSAQVQLHDRCEEPGALADVEATRLPSVPAAAGATKLAADGAGAPSLVRSDEAAQGLGYLPPAQASVQSVPEAPSAVPRLPVDLSRGFFEYQGAAQPPAYHQRFE